MLSNLSTLSCSTFGFAVFIDQLTIIASILPLILAGGVYYKGIWCKQIVSIQLIGCSDHLQLIPRWVNSYFLVTPFSLRLLDFIHLAYFRLWLLHCLQILSFFWHARKAHSPAKGFLGWVFQELKCFLRYCITNEQKAVVLPRVNVKFIYTAHLKTTTVEQSALQDVFKMI